MKKLNKKGFILVETLIVTVFVVTLFIVIYQATVPALGELEQQNKYDDIDSVYYSNLYKQMLTRYANMPLIDTYLQDANNKYYMDITDCYGKVGTEYIYNNREYCKVIQENIKVGENDKIFITDYDVTNFKETVKNEDMFDSGTLSNFRDYMNTVSNKERFHSKRKNDSELDGKYRLFIVRQIIENDNTTTKRYANIGIYSGKYDKYLQGELVYYKVNNTTELPFYVLKNSVSTDTTVTLIAANNLSGTPYFNCTGTIIVPNQETSPLQPAFRTNVPIDDSCNSTTTINKIKDEINHYQPPEGSGENAPTQVEYVPNTLDNSNTLLLKLREQTSTWTNANVINDAYTLINPLNNLPEYTINYGSYGSGKKDYARLLTAEEILGVLGCGEDQTMCFDQNKANMVNFDINTLSWLSSNLTSNGYWTATAVAGSNLYAWAVMNGQIVPVRISEHSNIGIRPVIVVNKITTSNQPNTNLRRG